MAFTTIYMYSSIVIVLYIVSHFYNSYVVYGTKIKKTLYSKCILYRPPKVRPKNLTIGGRYFYGKI